MRFYLSKADEAGHESDRQRVMMQIVQELCKRPGLNKTGFDMPTIYVPNPNKPVRCVNQIDEVCKDIEKTIQQTIQNTLNSLEKDCDQIGNLVDEAIVRDNKARHANMKAYLKGGFLYLAVVSLPLALVLTLVLGLVGDKLVKVGWCRCRLTGAFAGADPAAGPGGGAGGGPDHPVHGAREELLGGTPLGLPGAGGHLLGYGVHDLDATGRGMMSPPG